MDGRDVEPGARVLAGVAVTPITAALNSLIDRREKERDDALAENARLRTELAALLDAAEVALRSIDGYDIVLGQLAAAVDLALQGSNRRHHRVGERTDATENEQ